MSALFGKVAGNEKAGSLMSFRYCLLPLLAAVCLSATPVRAQTLLESLAAAYENNPDLAAARAGLRATNEQVPQAKAGWRPSVSLSADVGGQRTWTKTRSSEGSAVIYPRGASLNVEQPVYTGGQVAAAVASAESTVLAQRSRLVTTEQNVLGDAVTAYMDVWRDESTLELNKNNLQVLQRQLQATQDRFRVGEVTRTDVAQAESRVANAQAQVTAAEGSLQNSRAIFLRIIGLVPGTLRPPEQIRGLPESLPATIEQARATNPSVIAARFDEAAAEYDVRQALGALLPSVSVQGSISGNQDSSVAIQHTDTFSQQITAQVTIPLYQQGAEYSVVRQAKEVANQQRLVVEQSRRAAEQQATSAWETWRSSRAQITSRREQVRAQQIALEGVRQENLVGTRTVLDVLNAEQELLDAQVSLVSAQRDDIVASFQLLSAVGRLTATELGLPVTVYDPVKDYDAVKDKWIGLQTPSEEAVNTSGGTQ